MILVEVSGEEMLVVMETKVVVVMEVMVVVMMVVVILEMVFLMLVAMVVKMVVVMEREEQWLSRWWLGRVEGLVVMVVVEEMEAMVVDGGGDWWWSTVLNCRGKDGCGSLFGGDGQWNGECRSASMIWDKMGARSAGVMVKMMAGLRAKCWLE